MNFIHFEYENNKSRLIHCGLYTLKQFKEIIKKYIEYVYGDNKEIYDKYIKRLNRLESKPQRPGFDIFSPIIIDLEFEIYLRGIHIDRDKSFIDWAIYNNYFVEVTFNNLYMQKLIQEEE